VARRSPCVTNSDCLGRAEPWPGASDLLSGLRSLDYAVVLASSAIQEDLDQYLDLLDVRGLVDAWTSEGDAEQTKPKPDLVSAAMAKLAPIENFIMIGDATRDAIAAARGHIPTIGLLSGGFGEDELRAAGCRTVYDGAADVAANLEDALSLSDSRDASAPALMEPTPARRVGAGRPRSAGRGRRGMRRWTSGERSD
jgi:phosphoglycolate phosphatase-like HAD superfamily hydrolase